MISRFNIAYVCRNNLTVVEAVRLRARGSTPAFEVDGRAPHTLHRHALRFEVRSRYYCSHSLSNWLKHRKSKLFTK